MIKLNCDMGEGMAYDTEIMPLIDMANLACGGHAGSEALMRSNIELALVHGVEIGAHPSYPDRANFGRKSMQMERAALVETIHSQIATLDRYCQTSGATLSYVKPHGALYNDMMREIEIFDTVMEAVSSYDSRLKLMILSSGQNAHYAKLASKSNLPLLYELFADRNYTDEGALVPRKQENAVIEEVDQIVARVGYYLETGTILSENNTALSLEGDSLCVHGDNEASLAVIKALRDVL